MRSGDSAALRADPPTMLYPPPEAMGSRLRLLSAHSAGCADSRRITRASLAPRTPISTSTGAGGREHRRGVRSRHLSPRTAVGGLVRQMRNVMGGPRQSLCRSRRCTSISQRLWASLRNQPPQTVAKCRVSPHWMRPAFGRACSHVALRPAIQATLFAARTISPCGRFDRAIARFKTGSGGACRSQDISACTALQRKRRLPSIARKSGDQGRACPYTMLPRDMRAMRPSIAILARVSAPSLSPCRVLWPSVAGRNWRFCQPFVMARLPWSVVLRRRCSRWRSRGRRRAR